MATANERILVDVGSSTVKVYAASAKGVRVLGLKSISFKDGFEPERGLSNAAKQELFAFIREVQQKNLGKKIKIFATAIFRKMTPRAKKAFVDEFLEKTGLNFNIINQELETFYLETALTGKCGLNEPILLINIGGASTELVVVKNNQAIERKNAGFGVGTVNAEFPTINEQTALVRLENVVTSVKNKLPQLDNAARIAFYTGGELTYMRLTQYPLKTNDLFDDPEHANKISFADFTVKNRQIFEKTTLQELESVMPHNPAWMRGARACSAIAQAICEKYGVKTIIPSDSNLIHGIARQEFRTVTISGSFRKHLDYILKVKKELESKNIKVLSPRFINPTNPGETFVKFEGEEKATPLQLERYHLDCIKNADALIICSPNGYVDASALAEIGYAIALDKRIIFTEKPEEFLLNQIPAEIGI